MFSLTLAYSHDIRACDSPSSVLANDTFFLKIDNRRLLILDISDVTQAPKFLRCRNLHSSTKASIQRMCVTPDKSKVVVMVEGVDFDCVVVVDAKAPFKVMSKVTVGGCIDSPDSGYHHVCANNQRFFTNVFGVNTVVSFELDGTSRTSFELPQSNVMSMTCTNDELWVMTRSTAQVFDLVSSHEVKIKSNVSTSTLRHGFVGHTLLGDVLVRRYLALWGGKEVTRFSPSSFPDDVFLIETKKMFSSQMQPWNYNPRNRLLVYHDTSDSKLLFYAPRFRCATALLCGLHARLGKDSVIMRVSRASSIFDLQVLALCLRFAGVVVRFSTHKGT